MRAQVAMDFTHGNWKNQNSGSRFGATCKTALPIQPIYRKNGPNGLNWQCCFAGSSKRPPGFWFFSIATGADYSFDLISIETYAQACLCPQFFGHKNLSLGDVFSLVLLMSTRIYDEIMSDFCFKWSHVEFLP